MFVKNQLGSPNTPNSVGTRTNIRPIKNGLQSGVTCKFSQSLEEGARKQCSECGSESHSRVQPHSEHRFPAPSSKTLPALVTPLKGHSISAQAAVHRHGQHPPKGSGTNMTEGRKETWCLTSTETMRLIRDGEKGGRGYGGEGEREIIYLSLHCHHQNDSCIKMGSDESHFNVSVGSDGRSRKTVSTNHNLF